MLKNQKPKTEIILSDLQNQYLLERDERLWQQMFALMVEYARSIALKINKGKVYIPPEKLQSIAIDSAIKILEKFHQDPDFRIQHSFAGILKWKVLESLYKGYEEEKNISLNTLVGKNKDTELLELKEKHHFEPFIKEHSVFKEIQEKDHQYILKELRNLLYEFDSIVNNQRLSMIARFFVLIYIRKVKIKNALNNFLASLNLSVKEENLLNYLLLEIRNTLKNLLYES